MQIIQHTSSGFIYNRKLIAVDDDYGGCGGDDNDEEDGFTCILPRFHLLYVAV